MGVSVSLLEDRLEATDDLGPLSLRPFDDADKPWLAALWKACYQPLIERIYGPWDDEQQRGFFDARFGEAIEVVIISDADGDVGAVYLANGSDDTYIESLEVHPDYQHRGIGSAVLRWVIRRAAAQGRGVTLQVRRLNDGARRLYEREGFVVVSQTDSHYLMRHAVDGGQTT